MILHLSPQLVGTVDQIEPVPQLASFEPASRGWITRERSIVGHIGDPRRATAEKGQTLFRIFSHDVVTFLERVVGWDGRSTGCLSMDFGHSGDDRRPAQAATLRAWGICGLLLLATMLMYMDRQALSQQKTEILASLKLTNTDYGRLELGFGLAFAVGGIVTGLMADLDQPAMVLPRVVLLGWSGVGFATGWVTNYWELLACRVLLGFFEAGHWPCALVTSQRLLSRRDRPLGNSILQSGTPWGALATPIVVLLLVSDRA